MNIEALQTYCTSLPAVTEDIKWDNDLCFSVGGKMFCVCSLEPPLRISFKVGDEEFSELSVRDGIIPAPYMARAKWVSVQRVTVLNEREWKHYIRQSYDLVTAKFTAKMRKELGIE